MTLPTGTPTEFTLARVEVKKTLPPKKEGDKPATIYKLGLILAADYHVPPPEQRKGWAELFVRDGDKIPGEDTVETLILTQPDNPDWALKASRPRSGGGRGRSPAETKAIQRQHSQEMGLRLLALLPTVMQDFAPAPSLDQALSEVRRLTDWFEKDISGG